MTSPNRTSRSGLQGFTVGQIAKWSGLDRTTVVRRLRRLGGTLLTRFVEARKAGRSARYSVEEAGLILGTIDARWAGKMIRQALRERSHGPPRAGKEHANSMNYSKTIFLYTKVHKVYSCEVRSP